MSRVVVTGVGLELSGAPGPDALLTPAPPAEGHVFEPHRKLGRKGLYGKDRATLLALAAVHDALGDAGLPRAPAEQLDADELGVVVSSNLGNLDTVCRIVDTIRAGSVADVSMMDAPNASSNVVASVIAIRFGCRGPNLMVCSGGGGGVDAVHLAANCIRAGRARRMIVCGVEPLTETAARLVRDSLVRWLGDAAAPRLADGAAALVLEDAETARDRGARPRAAVGAYGFAPDGDLEAALAVIAPRPPNLWLPPGGAYAPTRAVADRVRGRWKATESIDLAPIGEASGMLGVLQGVAACAWLRRRGHGIVLVTSGATFGDGASSLLLEGPPW